MRTIHLLLASTLLATTACNGTASEGGGGSPAASSTQASVGSGNPSGPSGTSGAGTGSGTTTSGGTSVGDELTLTLESFTVPPGGEVYKCQNFSNPFGGGDAEVSEFESHMAKGSHHLLLFYKDGATDGALEDCSGLEFAATPYSTQLPDDSLSFPDGVAATIPATTGLRIQSHYLNTTADTITAHVAVTFHLAAPGSVTQHAGVLFVVQPNIHIPAHSSQVVTDDCSIPQDMNLIKAGSHMHKHGTDFIATGAGNTLVHTTTWDDPAPTKFDPPDVLHAGDPLHFACTFQNDGDTPLTFGESASTNEMCIFVGSFFPIADGTATIGCN